MTDEESLLTAADSHGYYDGMAGVNNMVTMVIPQDFIRGYSTETNHLLQRDDGIRLQAL